MSSISFIKTAVKDFRVGAFMPSSKYAVKKIVREIRPEHKYIIEYGAGNGVITREILNCLPADGRLIAIELNKCFVDELKNIQDSRLTVLKGDVVSLSEELGRLGFPRIDAIISGIPFSLIKQKERERLVSNTRSFLSEDGVFVVYQLSVLILPVLKKFFSKTKINFELRNFPPYFIMVARS